MIFNYSYSDLNNDLLSYNNMKFDECLKDVWTNLLATPNVFNYKLSIRDEKILDGKYGFVLQLNPERSTKRRLPHKILSLKQAFNPSNFHFNKISEKELIMEMKDINKSDGKNIIIINASPICFGHSLICPNVDECLPQIITLQSLQFIFKMLFISNNRYFRIGFNSLCAMASVNHLHYHIICLETTLPAEKLKCINLNGPIYAIQDDYPAKGFCFQLKAKNDIEKTALDVYKLTNYLTENDIAHNVYIMRGDSLDGTLGDVWRIFVWARTNNEGTKELDSVNVAICEFSGHFPLKNEEEYSMSEETFADIMRNATHDTFNEICHIVSLLYV